MLSSVLGLCLAAVPASAAQPGARHDVPTIVADIGGRRVVEQAGTRSAATPPAGRVVPAVVGPLVGMGDSYSSGEGAPPWDSGTDTSSDTCHRSANSYQRQFAGITQTSQGAITHVACSGALIGDFYNNNHSSPSEGPQLNRLSSSDTMVVLTIGGNDAGFASVLATCVTSYLEFWSQDCQQYYSQNDGNNLNNKINGLAPKLTQAYRDVKAHAPNAAVWVVTYPHIFAGSCPFSGNPMRDTDAAWLNTVAYHLDDTIKQAATAAGVTGILDERDAFSGHEVCTSSPWVNGYTWSGTPWNYTSVSFHPMTPGFTQEADDLYWAVPIL